MSIDRIKYYEMKATNCAWGNLFFGLKNLNFLIRLVVATKWVVFCQAVFAIPVTSGFLLYLRF